MEHHDHLLAGLPYLGGGSDELVHLKDGFKVNDTLRGIFSIKSHRVLTSNINCKHLYCRRVERRDRPPGRHLQREHSVKQHHGGRVEAPSASIIREGISNPTSLHAPNVFSG